MNEYEKKKAELEELLNLLDRAKNSFGGEINKELIEFEKKKKEKNNELSGKERENKKEREIWLKLKQGVLQMAKERQIGFPWLAKAYDDLFEVEEREMILYLKNKKRPAVKASEVLKDYSLKRRNAEVKRKIAEYIVEYYENIAPFLVDLKEEINIVTEQERELLKEYSKEELQDQTTNYLTKEEYRKLPSNEKNQMALDRYWKRPKSKWHLGKIYERYVGYLYEEKGYDVDYVGIFKGFEDLGRDLIAEKNNEIIVIQCKNWSKFKTIYEKHIFQFFGTVFKYKDENEDKNVKAVFYSATKLSDLAKRFAKELNIDLKENFKMRNEYPCVKCNISKVDGSKIYHLPFDQQYDNVKVEKHKGEFYCETVKEAEEAGFRRAFRYKGFKKD
jgi:DUF2075 family protein